MTEKWPSPAGAALDTTAQTGGLAQLQASFGGAANPVEAILPRLVVTPEIEPLYADAWWPVTRFVLVMSSAFYAGLALVHVLAEAEASAPWLVSVAAFSFLVTLGMLLVTRSQHRVRLWQVELTDITIVLIMLTNIYAYQFMHLQIDRMSNFIILPVLIAVIGATFRIIIPCLIVSMASLLFFAGQIGAQTQSQFLTLALSVSVAAPAIHAIIRFIIIREIQARQEAEHLRDAARRRADFDGLTGLANRSRFFAELQDRLDQPDSGSWSVGFLDIDGFKAINDIYGNVVGDRLLAAVAQRLLHLYGENGLVARIDSDGFGIVSHRNLDTETIRANYAADQSAFEEPFLIDGIEIRVTASIGVVPISGSPVSARVVGERGEYALFRAKREPRGSVVVFSDDIALEMENLGAIEHALRNADLVNELYLEFQPQVELQTGKVIAFEALARWKNKSLGQIRPDLFIGVAERAGIVNRLTLVLLEKALTNAATWPEHVGLAFNLSARDILSPHAIDDICRLINKSEIDPGRVEFEVTETSVMTDFEQAKRAIEQLTGLGCSIALDDFGSGYSNFIYIDELDISTLKLDRSFVTRMARSGRTVTIVRTIIDLCRNLQLDAVIEGVEREEEANVLTEIGASIAQGYLYSRPIAASTVLDFLQSSGADRAPQTTG